MHKGQIQEKAEKRSIFVESLHKLEILGAFVHKVVITEIDSKFMILCAQQQHRPSLLTKHNQSLASQEVWIQNKDGRQR